MQAPGGVTGIAGSVSPRGVPQTGIAVTRCRMGLGLPSLIPGGFAAQQLTFTYRSDTTTKMREIHTLSLGRNEGRGGRIKIPASSKGTMTPLVAKIMESYQPDGTRTRYAPYAPTRDGQPVTPLRYETRLRSL